MTRNKTNLKGILAAALAASGFSVSLVSAGFAFRAGADPATVITFRGLAGLIIGLIMVRLMTRNLKIPSNAIMPLGLMTLGMITVSFGYMGAIQYIPISLATLIFYMFPTVVLIISSLTARRMPSLLSGLAFFMAFAGLASALGVSINGLDWHGVAWALAATAGGTLLFFYGSVTAQRTGIALFIFYSQAAIAGAGVLAMISLDGINLPTGTTGAYAFIGIFTGYLVGISMHFFAVRLINPALAALVFNVEPVVTISLSAILLGDILTLSQYIGGAFVIFGVLLATRLANRMQQPHY